MSFKVQLKGNFRKTSKQEFFPWSSSRVPFIFIDGTTGDVTSGKTITEKMGMLLKHSAKRGDILLAAWPGQWSTDVFEVDKPEEALNNL